MRLHHPGVRCTYQTSPGLPLIMHVVCMVTQPLACRLPAQQATLYYHLAIKALDADDFQRVSARGGGPPQGPCTPGGNLHAPPVLS